MSEQQGSSQHRHIQVKVVSGPPDASAPPARSDRLGWLNPSPPGPATVSLAQLRVTAWLILAAAALTLAGLVIAPTWPMVSYPPEDAVRYVPDAQFWWIFSKFLWIPAIALTTSAMAALAALIARGAGRASANRVLAPAASALFVLGAGLLIASQAVITITFDVASRVGDAALPTWFEPLTGTSTALWIAGMGIISGAAALFGVLLWDAAVLPRWTAWLLFAYVVIAIIVQALMQGDLPPFIFFLFTTPFLAVAALRAARRAA